jgi:orotidine-5'-phosphate decarboxylase
VPQRNFRRLIEGQWQNNHRVCVGLDPDWEKIPSSLKTAGGQERDPGDVLFDFNRAIIDATCDVAGTYKPQSAYYEKWGVTGCRTLKRTVEYLDERAPLVPRILDAKRADIDRTNRGYVDSAFGQLGFDAITLHPYLGGVSALRPFLDQAEKGCIVLCRTSNPDAREFQDLPVVIAAEKLDELLAGPAGSTDRGRLEHRQSGGEYRLPLYLVVALRVANHWNTNSNCGLVVGATYPEEAREIRQLVGDDLPFLVPGIGTQGGDLQQAVQAGRNSRGEELIVSSSSGIIHASQGADFAERAREKATELNEAINRSLRG